LTVQSPQAYNSIDFGIVAHLVLVIDKTHEVETKVFEMKAAGNYKAVEG